MRLLLSWVREFVDLKASAAEVAEMLALRGFEVAAVEPLERGDAVVDVEVTANRPDCLSVVGLARELAASYDLPLRPLPSDGAGGPDGPSPAGAPLTVVVEDEGRCPRYTAALAETQPSRTPDWMTYRLEAAGLRPITPIVDVTNYVLLELGHPMHAFDAEALEGRELHIRGARPGESLTTLDGVERMLDPEMLVIADRARPQAVAGVMGGARSEVSARTRVVAFESAYFDPPSVRRTSKRLGLVTEASARFERGTDVNAPPVALRRALRLMREIGAGRLAAPIIDRYPQPRGPRALRLRRDRLRLLLGLTVPDAAVRRILDALGLQATPVADGWEVVVPTSRVDLLREVDLIEEVGRHHGFDRLEPTFPPLAAPSAPPDPRVSRDRLVRRILTSAGLSEAVTFGFVEAAAARAFLSPDSRAVVAIRNPLSAKFEVLRPYLLCGLIDALAHNRRHGRRDVGLFEVGSRFDAGMGESRAVGMAWTGAAAGEHWSGGARDVDFYDLKGLVEHLCGALGVTVDVEPATTPFLVAGVSAEVRAGGVTLGHVGLLQPAIVDARGAPRLDRVYVAELDLDRLATLGPSEGEPVRPLPRFPFVVRDLSIVVDESLPAAIIRGTIQAAAAEAAAPLAAIGFFDRYVGQGVPAGSVSLSIRLTFQAADRTLTDAEVQQSFDRIVTALGAAHGARQR